ncbi:MAG: hypothetical protein IJ225_05570 [Solobacterium sp.]|nr:hypothetical protein [Solobacterium sp.]
MKETMLMTQALDERDLLVKKINDKLERLEAADVKKRNESKGMNYIHTPEEFKKDTTSAYQQIMDLIRRYQRLDAAIISSNAATTVETSYGTLSVASAIALRNRLNKKGIYGEQGYFEERLINQLENSYEYALTQAKAMNQRLESQAESMRLSILGKDARGKEDKPLEVVEAYVKENTAEVMDPLDVNAKTKELQEMIDRVRSELDTRIKVANATTVIEF